MTITEQWGSELRIDSSRDAEQMELRKMLDAAMAQARTSADEAAALLGGPVRLSKTWFEWVRADDA